uniref:Exonuclease domain-containing protein n=1 Tax=Opuntia streptacantha TaxID=393608 RepID=A0A7C9DB49_OPUST
MASCRTFSSIPLIRCSSTVFSLIHFSTFPSSPRPVARARCVISSASRSIQYSSNTDPASDILTMRRTWKPMCLYYTQGKCTLMDDRPHLDKFSHSCSEPLEANIAKSKNLRSQNVDFFLVLDLEGKIEILEFPVVLVDAKTMEVVDLFHRFVRPSNMTEHRINEYIEGKYGKLSIDRVWHDTAMPFVEVIREFEAWMTDHNLWRKERSGPLTKAAFVTCGNWDIKTKIRQQCRVSAMKIPPYFMEWINIKDVYLNFYNRRAPGMRTMLNELRIPLLGSHHLGIDDTKNIARLLQRMLADGVLMQITARRNPANPETVEFLFKNRIR